MYRVSLLAIFLAGGLAFASPPIATPPPSQPVVFEPNRGQALAQSNWIAHGPGYELLFRNDGVAIILPAKPAAQTGKPSQAVLRNSVIQLKLEGSRPWTHLSGLEATGGVSNYLRRPNGAPSLTGVPHYARLRVADVYQGVDMVFYNRDGNFEYDFELRPGADPRQIRIAFEGQRDMHLDAASGDLVLTTPAGSQIRQLSPKVYQQTDLGAVAIAAKYELAEAGHASLALASYDRSRPLTIDPTVQVVKTIVGADSTSYGRAVAVDAEGNAYVTGSANEGYPTTNGSNFTSNYVPPSIWDAIVAVLTFNTGFTAIEEMPAGIDAVVTKISPQGTILFSSYYGLGVGNAIAVDVNGVVVTGWTTGDPNADVTSGTGLFALKLNRAGDLIYFSVLDLGSTDMGLSVALDASHNAWIAGITSYTGITHGAAPDALVEEVSPTGVFSKPITIGGSGPDRANGIAVDTDGSPWLTGQTCSSDFPGTPGFNYLKGRCGIFVTKLTEQAGTFKPGVVTVFGGSLSDSGLGIAIDPGGNAYVTGRTSSSSFYTSRGAYQAIPTGAFTQGFITKLDSFGNFLGSTLLGSNGATQLSAIAINGAGEIYVGGKTLATTFPMWGPLALNPTAGIIAKFTPDLTALLYSKQIGVEVNGVAVHEIVPGASPAQIYTAGLFSESLVYAELLDDLQYTRIRNHWQTGEYINIHSRVPEAGPVAPGWFSAQWTFELQPGTNGDPVNTPVFWIHNRWQPDASGEYLNVESGSLQSTSIGPGWLSARWTLEPVPGTNLYRIRNVWKPDLCLNVESGMLQASEAGPGWWSAMWSFERVEQ